MFTPIEKNRKQQHSRLLENITELHSRIYKCRNTVLAALEKENLEPNELNSWLDLNWNLFLLEVNSGSQRDELKHCSYLGSSALNAHIEQYEGYSETYSSIVQKMNGFHSMNGTNNNADKWFDWDYAEDESSDESCVSIISNNSF
ncbi:hypothetical protein [Legionella parisiensis]|uniref:Uncharacterized protein n=1 Tax=Legionella parisiensis TaxID=45071 RepID=A0A1E5JKP1_9GAMM|nr:hypothetical protein [Legionella parisiensis]KTD43042.1 hypothetical protein Lpar_1019 [Legionella parisiensis]OEH45116.1 hypothetical protein lpari_03886 [Legionella parisiensis]STX77883.1 Uncharacterised protein [Legionella parisiensis]